MGENTWLCKLNDANSSGTGEQRLDGSEKALQLVILFQFARLCACSCEHL